MGQPYGAAGTKFYISTAVLAEPADATAYAALTWTEIGDPVSIGDNGDEAQVLTASTLQDQRVFKAKGPRDPGSVPLLVLDRPDDAGQIALSAAQQTNFSYPIKIVSPNRLTTGGTDGIRYFIALVTSDRLGQTNPTGIQERTFTLAINSKVTTVAPT